MAVRPTSFDNSSKDPTKNDECEQQTRLCQCAQTRIFMNHTHLNPLLNFACIHDLPSRRQQRDPADDESDDCERESGDLKRVGAKCRCHRAAKLRGSARYSRSGGGRMAPKSRRVGELSKLERAASRQQSSDHARALLVNKVLLVKSFRRTLGDANFFCWCWPPLVFTNANQ